MKHDVLFCWNIEICYTDKQFLEEIGWKVIYDYWLPLTKLNIDAFLQLVGRRERVKKNVVDALKGPAGLDLPESDTII